MADVVLIIAVTSIIAIFLILLTLLRPKSTKSSTEENVVEEVVRNRERVNVVAAGGNRDQDMARFIRARRARGRPNRQVQRNRDVDDDDDMNEVEEEDPLAETMALPEGKIGTKKRKKLEMKAEKKLQREREEEEREERKQRQILLEEQRKKQEEKEKREEAKREEEEKLKKEQEEREEYEQYLKLKESFTVEGEGFDEVQTENESQSILREFIDYVKKTKVVLVEDLAAHFKLKTQDAIDRLQTFDETGKLTGVMDDRGKFIYVSREELEQVARFIKQRGRVSIAEVVESSNTLINLTGCTN